MDTIRDDGDHFNEQFYGSECLGVMGGYHELPNDVAFPGDVRLDDNNGDDVELATGIAWAFREVPALRFISPMPTYARGQSSASWFIIVRDGAVGDAATSSGCGAGDSATEAIEAAVRSYRDTVATKTYIARAKALDNAASVAPSAEGQAA